jgi:hypothetical protein
MMWIWSEYIRKCFIREQTLQVCLSKLSVNLETDVSDREDDQRGFRLKSSDSSKSLSRSSIDCRRRFITSRSVLTSKLADRLLEIEELVVFRVGIDDSGSESLSNEMISLFVVDFDCFANSC